MGFPGAHRYAGNERNSGVVKIIEGSDYDIEIDLGKSTRDANLNGGVAVCLFVKKNKGEFDYREYLNRHVLGCDDIIRSCEIKYGKSNKAGVIAKCWIKGADWHRDEFDSCCDALCRLFVKFRDAMSKLVTTDDVRDEFLQWAMDQRLKDERQEKCVWTDVRERLNRQLQKEIGSRVGALATVKNLNYLDLEKSLDRLGLLEGAVANWFDDGYSVPLRSVVPPDVVSIKKTLIDNAYIGLFNAFFAERKNLPALTSEVLTEISKMRATEYLIKMLARSQRGKKFENYVVTGIWSRLCTACRRAKKPCPRIVTQQLVRRDGNHHRALIDLYFPEIKLAVECDEAQHQENVVEDALREEDIIASGLIRNRDDLYRIDATCSCLDMDKEMDAFVEKILDRINATDAKIVGLKSPVDIAKENGALSDTDGLLYQTKADALEALGIRRWKNGPYCSNSPYPFWDESGSGWRVLFLDVDKKNRGKGWEETDKSTDIVIANGNGEIIKHLGECAPQDKVIVFVAEPNNCGYSFVGVYNLVGDALKKNAQKVAPFSDMFG